MRSFLAVLVSLTSLAGCGEQGHAERATSTVRFEGTDATLAVEVADDTDEQRRGLMGVEHLPANQGMAFVWPEPVASTFWMKDTLVPLSVAFVDETGHVIDVLDMQPCETDTCPTYGVNEPYVFAVEANLGWFDDHSIEAGDRAELREDLDG
jgi:uncharacterized membrane protein (UPF0127 family)